MYTDLPPPSPEHANNSERPIHEGIVEWVSEQGVVVGDRELLAGHIASLINEFAIEDEVFHEERDRLLMAAIANELGSRRFGEDELLSRRLSNMIMLAFGNRTRFKDEVERDKHKPEFPETRIRAAYEKVTNPAVSEKLREYIQTDPIFIEMRRWLGVTDDSENRFTPLVLDVCNKHTLRGWQPTVGLDDLGGDEANLQAESQNARVKELEENARYLLDEIGSKDDQLAPAWVEMLENGEVLLCLHLPTAEKILNQGSRSDDYGKEDLLDEKATLLHEFVHTQRIILRSGTISLGVGLEELRAEYFSGDRMGYDEIRNYFMSMKALYGYSPKDSLEAHGVFDPTEFELEIAREVGLEGYLDAMTLIPPVYATRSVAGDFLKQLVADDGGIDGHFERMFARAVTLFGEDEIAPRLSAYVDDVVRSVETYEEEEDWPNKIRSRLSDEQPKLFADLVLADYASRY